MIPARALVSAAASRRYDDSGEPAYTPAERILLALRWFGWVEPQELFDALDLPALSLERAAHVAALARLVTAGRVERRMPFGTATHSEVRLAAVQPTPREPHEPVHRLSRAERILLGTCRHCDADPKPGYAYCALHLRLRRESSARCYARRKAA